MTNNAEEIEDDDYSLPPLAPLRVQTVADVSGRSAAAVEEIRLTVPLQAAGKRFDQFLAAAFPAHSRSRLAELVKQGQALLDGKAAAPKTMVTGGEEVCIWLLPRADEAVYLPESIPLDVVYEDSQVIVINKPAGLVVHPGAGNWQGTLLNGLLYRFPEVAAVPRAGIVHRLDKDTTGIMVVARTEAAQTALVRQLQARTVRREYLAVVRGHPPQSGTVDAPIGRHPRDRVRMAVVDEGGGGKAAVTHYTVIEDFADACLVRCRLETGRTHQIRVHLQSIGFPLVGDQVYGGQPKGGAKQDAVSSRFERQALHAERLAFLHPETGSEVSFHAPVADDMRDLLTSLRARA